MEDPMGLGASTVEPVLVPSDNSSEEADPLFEADFLEEPPGKLAHTPFLEGCSTDPVKVSQPRPTKVKQRWDNRLAKFGALVDIPLYVPGTKAKASVAADGSEESDKEPRKLKKEKEPRAEPPKKKARVELGVADMLRDLAGYKVVDGVLKKYKQPIMQMEDSTADYKKGRKAKLYERLEQKGYVTIRGVVPEEVLKAARDRVFRQLTKMKARDDRGRITMKTKGLTLDVDEGELTEGCDQYHKDSLKQACPQLKAVASCPELGDLLMALAEGKAEFEGGKVEHSALMFNPFYTYLRVKGVKGVGPEHMDYYYFRAHSDFFKRPTEKPQLSVRGKADPTPVAQKDIRCRACKKGEVEGKVLLECDECPFAHHLCCKPKESYVLPHERPEGRWYCHNCRPQPFIGKLWIALNDVEATNSVLCVQPGSHRARNLEKDYKGYGRVPTTWYNEFRGEDHPWHTSAFKAGDVVLFDMRVVHGASSNYSDDFRLSLDTRFMLKGYRENWGQTLRSRFAEAAAQNKAYNK